MFLEGDDYRLLRRFATRLGLDRLAQDIDITVIPIGGFSQRQRIEDAAWTFEKVLKADISIAGLVDRDYRCQEEIDELTRGVRATVPHFHVLAAKEIENYLLVPAAIAKAIRDRMRDRKCSESEIDSISTGLVEDLVSRLSEEIKSDVMSQTIANRMRYFSSRSAKDASTVAADAIRGLDSQWASVRGRLMVVPGKRLLANLNGHLQRHFHISVTAAQIIRNMSRDEVGADLSYILEDLNQFAESKSPG